MKNLIKSYILSLLLSLFLILSSCGGVKSDRDTRKTSTNASERARQAIEQGKGLGIGNIFKKGQNFEFSSSNPMWRASLEVLDFLPFAVVDYSGGMLVTDWYSDNINSNRSLKITLRFLSNEIRVDSLKIIVHEKKCLKGENCSTKILDSQIKDELLTSIVRKAAILEKEIKKK